MRKKLQEEGHHMIWSVTILVTSLAMISCIADSGQQVNAENAKLYTTTKAKTTTITPTLGDGVNIQPTYYCNGEQTLGWNLMKNEGPNIKAVRIELDPVHGGSDMSDFVRWIKEANDNGYQIIATYHWGDGENDPAVLMQAANWWKNNYDTLRPDSGSFIINLINEWGDHTITTQEYADAYNQAIAIVREVYSGPIIIDAPGWGQGVYRAADASSLINDDNIIHSVHIYPSAWVATTGTTMQPADLDYLENNSPYPIMAGEFGPHSQGSADWSGLVDHAKSLGWSVFAWAWNGDGTKPKGMNMADPYWGDDCSATSYTKNPNYWDLVYPKLGNGSDTDRTPTASFTYSVTDLTVDFDASGSADSDGTIESYDWDFGDGTTGSGEFVSHTYSSSGDYTVTLTVTDDSSATNSASQTISVSDGSSDIRLSVTGYKHRGLQKADLTWSGVSTTNVEIYRDGSLIRTTKNDGEHTDNIDHRGSGSYDYQLCEEVSSICSDVVTVTF